MTMSPQDFAGRPGTCGQLDGSLVGRPERTGTDALASGSPARAVTLVAVVLVAAGVASGAAAGEFVGVGAFGDLIVGVVVVLEEFGAAAVDASGVSFVDDAFLAGSGVATSGGGVDGPVLGVVDEYPDERAVDEFCDHRIGERGAVV